MPTKLLLIFLLFISITSHSQTAESFEYDPASIRKLDSVRENIYGAWFLANTFSIGKEKNDTISKKVYNTSKESPAMFMMDFIKKTARNESFDYSQDLGSNRKKLIGSMVYPMNYFKSKSSFA